jgi:hypothetical protein
MSMSLAELDAQDVTLLPERATLHGGLSFTVVSIHQTAIANSLNLGGGIALFGGHVTNSSTAVAAIVNL